MLRNYAITPQSNIVDLERAALIEQRDLLATALETCRSLAGLPSNSAGLQMAMARLNKIVDRAGDALRQVGAVMSGCVIDKDLRGGGNVRPWYGELYIADTDGGSVRLNVEQAKELLPILEAMIALDKVNS